MPDSYVDFYQRHNELLREIFNKAINADEALHEGNLLYLLQEGELDQPDVEALRTSTAELKTFLAELLGVEEISTNLPSAAAWLKAQGRNVSAAEKFVMKLDLNKPKGASDWVKSVFGKGFTVANGVAAVAMIDSLAFGGMKAISEAAELIKRNLDGKIPDDVKLVDVPADTGLTKEDVAAGIKKAFQKSIGNDGLKDAKSFMKKLGGKAAKMPGVKLTDFPVDAVMPEIMDLTLPQLTTVVESFAGKIPTPDEGAVDDALDSADDSSGESAELSDDQVGKAGQVWLDKLKADGADASLLKLGKQWMAAVSKDPEFKKIAGLTESYNASLAFVLLEQVKWPDLLQVFVKNAPGPLKGVDAKTIEPLVAPFGQALADQGIEVVDKAGKPFKPPVQDTDEAVQDVEEDIPDDPEAETDAEDAEEDDTADNASEISSDQANDILDGLEAAGIKNSREALAKAMTLFDLTLAEGRRWSLYDLLVEKVVKYSDIDKELDPWLPDGNAERISAVTTLKDLLQKHLGKEYDIAEIPEAPADSDFSAMAEELEKIRAADEIVPEGIDVEDITKSMVEKISADTGIEEQVVTDLFDPNKEAVEAIQAVPSEIKEKDPDWFSKVQDAANARLAGWVKKGLGSLAEEFGKLESEYGDGAGEAVAKFIEQITGSIDDAQPDLQTGLLEKIGEGLKDPQAAVGVLTSLVDLADIGEDEVKELLPQELANAVLDLEEEPPAGAEEIAVEKIYEYENSKGEKIFIKVVDENPQDGWWQAVQLAKDGKSWKKETQSFAAKEASFGPEVDEETAFGGATAGVSIKRADFNSKLANAIDNVYDQDEELLDLIAAERHDEKVPEIMAKVSQELFGDDFSLEESLSRYKLLPFLFEGNYTWVDVQKTIDKHSGEVPPDLLYAIFAKAIPDFKELGVEVSGVPEPDLDQLKSILSGEEIDPNAELDIEDPAGISDEEQKKLDAEAQKVAGGLGKVPIDKNKLAAILKKYPDIVGQGQKATRARRKLRKAINMAAGMEVFAENFDYGWIDKDRYILSESDESQAVARWRILAGIKDD